MAHINRGVDLYITKVPEFAKPILEHLRDVVHAACPEVEEAIKWGCPHFQYHGKILCGMAAFKEHCVLNFRLARLMKDPYGLLQTGEKKRSMGQFGRIRKLADLPSKKVLKEYIRQAMTLTDSGAQLPIARQPDRALKVPDDFLKALKKDKVAFRNFEKLSYYQRKEYVGWITEARTDGTRNKRIATSVEWLHDGKVRNWKYMA